MTWYCFLIFSLQNHWPHCGSSAMEVPIIYFGGTKGVRNWIYLYKALKSQEYTQTELWHQNRGRFSIFISLYDKNNVTAMSEHIPVFSSTVYLNSYENGRVYWVPAVALLVFFTSAILSSPQDFFFSSYTPDKIIRRNRTNVKILRLFIMQTELSFLWICQLTKLYTRKVGTKSQIPIV